jgi:pyruvate dehydrogenase complex dehydrogenase (E1) component
MDEAISRDDLVILGELERKVLWLASWTIHHANHVRESTDGLKVGGHQASSASLATIMTALYFGILRPQDRVAVKPHASPNFHAIQYLLGRQTCEKLANFRGYKGAQSYPSRTKDTDDVDFSTGSVGLGVAQTLFSSLVQDYVRAHGWGLDRPEGRMVALIGDAELDEGNIFECLLEGWKQSLRNCWWIVDYNRQSLDAVTREGLWQRYEELFDNFGWEVVIQKYGSLLEAAFCEPGGDILRQWIDRCPNQLYSALVFQGRAAWRRRLNEDIGDQGPVTSLIEARSDEELARLMTNLAGHDVPTLMDAFGRVRHDRPAFALDYVQRDHGEGGDSERNWLRDETGGSIYLRLSTRPIEQIKRPMTSTLRQAIVDGAYWLREPGPNCQVVIAYTGAVAPEAIQATGFIAEDRLDVGLLAVTSADRLNAGWTAAMRARERGLLQARSHIERLFAGLPPHCGLVTVLDGHPATLAWLGAVNGHRARPLGVEHFGQTGTIADLYRHYGIDTNAIIAAAQAVAPGRPIRHLKAVW